MPNTVALAPANDLAWAGTVSPSGPREWLANGRTMNLRSDGLHWQVHSHLIRRTVAERHGRAKRPPKSAAKRTPHSRRQNGPCLAAAKSAKLTGLGETPTLLEAHALPL